MSSNLDGEGGGPPRPNSFKRASVKLPAQFQVGGDQQQQTTQVTQEETKTVFGVGLKPAPTRKVTFGGSRLQNVDNNTASTSSSSSSTTTSTSDVNIDELIDSEPVTRPRTTRAKTMIPSQMLSKPMPPRGLQPGRLKIGGRENPPPQQLVDVDDDIDKLDSINLKEKETIQEKDNNNNNNKKLVDVSDDDDDDDEYIPNKGVGWASIMAKTKNQKSTGGRVGSGRFVVNNQTQQENGVATNEQTGEEVSLEPSSRRGTFKKAIVIGTHNDPLQQQSQQSLIDDEDPGSTQRISSLDLATVQRPKQQYHTIDPASIPQWKKTNEEYTQYQQPAPVSKQPASNNSGGTFANMTNTFASLLKSSPNKQPAQPGQATKSRAELEYNEYLDKARQATFQDIAALNFIYQAGKDNLGRTVIVVVASHLPAKQVDMERVLLYTISVMDPVVEGDYVLVYAHTNMNNDNKPTFAWLKKVYTIFNRKYKKNLKGLYIVHPTTWIKFTLRLFKPFLSSKFWRKLVYIDDLSDLFKFFSKEQLNLPQHIMMHKPAGRKAQPIFGAPLEEVVNRPDNPGEIPILFEKGLAYLERRALLVEGIFRLSGANSQIKSLKNCFDAGEDVDLNDCEDVHTVAGLLKLYLRELPEPLFPFEIYSSFIEISKGEVPKQQKIDSLKLLISLLPAPNRALTKHLLRFLEKVIQNCGVNKMNAVNLSIVFAPNLLKDKDNNVMNVVADAQYVNHVVQILLENVNQII